MTLKLRYLILFFALLMAFVAPDLVSLLWSAPFRLMDTLPLLPAALNDPQRLYLYGLWLGGTIYFSALMWVAVTRRNKGYLVVAVAQLVFVIGITLCKVPFGEQNQRRLQSMNQLETPAWSDFLYDRHARFIQIVLRGGPLDQHKITEQFLAQKKRCGRCRLAGMKKMPPPRMRSGSRRWAIVNGKRMRYPNSWTIWPGCRTGAI